MFIIEAALEYILIKSWDSIEIQITPWRFYSSYKMQRNSEKDDFSKLKKNSFLKRDKELYVFS